MVDGCRLIASLRRGCDEKRFNRDIARRSKQLSMSFEKGSIDSSFVKVRARNDPMEKLDIVANAQEHELLERAFHAIDCSLA